MVAKCIHLNFTLVVRMTLVLIIRAQGSGDDCGNCSSCGIGNSRGGIGKCSQYSPCCK